MKHIGGFSGGIDSQAMARWLLNRFPPSDVILVSSNAGQWEDPLTMEFIANYSAKVHKVEIVDAIISDMWETPGFAETKGYDGNAMLTFEIMCEIKGRAPSRRAQFCTEKLKLVPQRRYSQSLTEEFERYTGKRRQESESRKNCPAREWDNFFDCWVNHPIFDWKKEMCFDYVKHHDEEVNPLYFMGFGRVGCAPCINSGKDDILLWADRRPDAIVKVRALENRTGRTFFAPMVPGMTLNFIDDVLAWAKTSHGGRQFRILPEREACESKYGLCE